MMSPHDDIAALREETKATRISVDGLRATAAAIMLDAREWGGSVLLSVRALAEELREDRREQTRLENERAEESRKTWETVSKLCAIVVEERTRKGCPTRMDRAITWLGVGIVSAVVAAIVAAIHPWG